MNKRGDKDIKRVFMFFVLMGLLTFILQYTYAQNAIEWLSFEEAVERSKTEPKKLLINVYTSWCVFCRKMDKETFGNKSIAAYVNAYFYPVKLNAEMRDTVWFRNKAYVLDHEVGTNGTHQLALSLLNGRAQYPGIVFLDEKFNMLKVIIGYRDVAEMELYLRFYGDGHYKTTDWKIYRRNMQKRNKNQVAR